ncbi:MAG: metal ABC transporter ATP-binding protein [Fimbriiglobus sp.]
MTISLDLIESPEVRPPLVSIQDLRVQRGNKMVLKGISASFRRGEITAIIGLNGCGKSTLLRTLLHEFAFTGRIAFHCGHDHRQPRPEHIGYVPQRLTIDPRLPLTVRDLMGLTLQKRPLFFGLRRGLTAKMETILAQVGVSGVLDTPLDGLSGGQLQRVLLALALEPSPELLLLDEPATGIDFQSQQAFYALIGDLNRTLGVTIVLVSHDLGIVGKIAHQVVCLKDGIVAVSGPPSHCLTPEALRETYGAGLALLGQAPAFDQHEHTPGCGHL